MLAQTVKLLRALSKPGTLRQRASPHDLAQMSRASFRSWGYEIFILADEHIIVASHPTPILTS